MKKYIQLVDGVGKAEFCCLQDESVWPGVIEVDDDDPRYLVFIGSSTPVVESAEVRERTWRDTELSELAWLRDRHRDQLEIGAATTLSAEQFNELLVYMQALRDWPQSDAFPNSSERPVAPTWIAGQFL